MLKIKKWIFSKNCLTLFVSGREKKRAFSCTLSVLAKNSFWPKTVQTRKHYKNSGSSGNCPKPKMTPLFWEGVFLHGWRSGFYCVFEKVFFFSLFVVFSVKHSSCNTNFVCWERKCKKNSGLFLKMARRVFMFFFQALMWVCFLSVEVASVLKMLVFLFPNFLGFVAWLILVYLGLEGLGVFVFLVFVFFCVLVLFMFCLLCFYFVVGCCFLFFFEGLRVRWGGPKGHLTWP